MNYVTNILGTLLIIAAGVSVFYLDKIDWMDASFGIASGVGLIYTKNSHLLDKLKELRDGNNIKK